MVHLLFLPQFKFVIIFYLACGLIIVIYLLVLSSQVTPFYRGRKQGQGKHKPLPQSQTISQLLSEHRKMLDPGRQWILQETSLFLFALWAYLALAKYQTFPGLGVQARTIVS